MSSIGMTELKEGAKEGLGRIEIENVDYVKGPYKIREKRFTPDEGMDNGYRMIIVGGAGMCAGNHHYFASELCGRHGYDVRLLETLFVKNRATDVTDKKDNEITGEDMDNILSESINCARYDNKTGEEKKVVTFGHSMGGYPVLHNLDEHIERAVTYGTPDIGSYPAANLITWFVKLMVPLNIKFPIRKMLEFMLEKETVDYFSKEMPKDPNYEMDNCPTHYPSRYLYSMVSTDIPRLLSEADTPVTVMCGEYDGVTKGSLEKLEKTAEDNDNVDVVLVPEAYHIRPCVRGEKLMEFTDILDRRIRGGLESELYSADQIQKPSVHSQGL